MGIVIFSIFVICAVYVQFRGRVRHQKLTRRLTDHSNLLAPINCLFYGFSAVKNRPYLNLDDFPELALLQDNWQVIREEALGLHEQSEIKASKDLDDLGFNSFFRTGWKRFYLSWYGDPVASARALCPKTCELLAKLPNVKGAMFAMLPPGARLVKHRDPYAGSLRYHLGLVTPNSEDCYIDVDGEKYHWRDGEAVMFDETYIHYAENKTDQNRIVLFLDVKRPVTQAWVDGFNHLFSRAVVSATVTKNLPGDKVGWLNRVFGRVYKVRSLGKKLKAYNARLYYTLQYGLYLLLIYTLFFSR
ncbi:aspartyl/asparaginyl beta-hydroxylase domain-containing protein [Gilvimarinus sp. SDUM040013]|uniref:Aspartyl/asparaginyl beta-hydroxylase domain-containing protein n=1 Tax=Gilvimarinus gilvus TaxID=3058038 RepID=A0ABU4RX95_9GAMM|nr:aspartyl/asparaginyl beta-hydroxylase domain-containing protein [Gilvimarinus sp. SDUM040013]MDO3388614.1 aspartyl/asparaginyl beta-hydroxylase domain-containing protein [Gilvimarinus sp. SDUM040013]MDX6849509.1 aspartyl/asparaginyl beta-hydroxylase domain-containing protein [Gilvimarinus sp. SDUM040013]